MLQVKKWIVESVGYETKSDCRLSAHEPEEGDPFDFFSSAQESQPSFRQTAASIAADCGTTSTAVADVSKVSIHNNDGGVVVNKISNGSFELVK